MKLTLVQLSVFADRWRKLILTDEDLQALENALIQNPAAGDLVPGTGGMRKVRFAPPSWHTGKRGGGRVYYAYIAIGDVVYLFTIYGKNKAADITWEEKQAYAQVLQRLHKKYGA